jgi:hypothetical protein
MDDESTMMHNMFVPNSMWSCTVSTVVYLRNRTFSRAVEPSGGVPLTLLTYVKPNAPRFLVFELIVFAKIPDKLRRKLGEKAFRGLMVGYTMVPRLQPCDVPHYYLYARHVPGECSRLRVSADIDSIITIASNA